MRLDKFGLGYQYPTPEKNIYEKKIEKDNKFHVIKKGCVLGRI